MYEKVPLEKLGVVPGEAQPLITLKGNDPPPPIEIINQGRQPRLETPAPSSPAISGPGVSL